MVEVAGRQDYLGAAIAEIDKLMLATLGTERGGECAHLFAVHLNQEVIAGHLSREVLSEFMTNGLAPGDAGLVILDNCVAMLKDVAGADVDPAVASLITDFEKVIDEKMMTNPGHVLPHNGRFSAAADTVGLDKYFKPDLSGR